MVTMYVAAGVVTRIEDTQLWYRHFGLRCGVSLERCAKWTIWLWAEG